MAQSEYPWSTPKNKIKIRLTEDEMTFLSKKLYNQLRAVVRETGEELIRQSILRDYNFKRDEQDLLWQTEIASEEKFKIKFELVCQVGDIIKVISLRKKKDVKRKRFLLM